MKKHSTWILAAVIIAVLASPLLWNFSMRAATRPGRGAKVQVAADNPAKENFDIRNRESKDAASKINEVSDGSPGDISLATPATFTLIPVTPGAPAITQTATARGGGVGGTLAACAALNNVPVNVYDVAISVGGNYYAGSGGDALAVYDPSLGFVTGGGAIVCGGRIAVFGFNVKYKKSGAPQGDLLYIELQPTGVVKLKSVAMQSLSIAGDAGVFIGKATLNGVGNHTFRVTVIDDGEPGRSDRFGLQVTASGEAIIPDLTFDPITLKAGNILVPHQYGRLIPSSQKRLLRLSGMVSPFQSLRRVAAQSVQNHSNFTGR